MNIELVVVYICEYAFALLFSLSMGDMHFSQGDGEVSFCGAIEMSGFLELKCSIIRGGMEV